MVVQAMQGQLQELKEKETREQLRAARPKAVQQLQAAVRGHQGRRWAHFRDPERAARRLQAAIRGRYQSVRVLNGKRRDGTYCYYWDCYARHLHVFAGRTLPILLNGGCSQKGGRTGVFQDMGQHQLC